MVLILNDLRRRNVSIYKFMRCSDVVELNIQPRRHVGGILNATK